MTNARVVRLPERTGNFSIFSNEAMQSEITGNAFKLLARSFNLSETWDYTVRGMCTLMNWGEKKIRNALRSLIKNGFASCHKQGRAGQGVTEGGEFLPDYYIFYESPVLNPYFQNSEMHGECDIFTGAPYGTPSRSCRKAVQVKTKEKTKEMIVESVSLAPEIHNTVEKSVERLTDNPKSENNTYLAEVKHQLAEMTGFPFLKENAFKSFIADMIPRIANLIADQKEILDKIQKINQTECSLIPFMLRLKQKCDAALENLKFPQARENFLLTTVRNIILEHKTEQPEAEKKSESENRTLSFREMLRAMRTKNTTLISESDCHTSIFDNEESFREYFGRFDLEDWEIRSWQIPEDFQNQPVTMEHALKFLIGFHDLENNAFKAFADETIRYLSEALYTKKASYAGTEIDTNTLIARLNYISCDMYGNDDSLIQFLNSFYRKFCSQTEKYPIKSNRKGYITKMLISYLNGEYQATDLLANARLRNNGYSVRDIDKRGK